MKCGLLLYSTKNLRNNACGCLLSKEGGGGGGLKGCTHLIKKAWTSQQRFVVCKNVKKIFEVVFVGLKTCALKNKLLPYIYVFLTSS